MNIIDETDLKILRLLQSNANLTIKDLAAEINLSTTPIHERIKKLENEGYIHKYVTILSKKKLNRSLVVYCNVTLDKQRHDNFDEFNRAIMQMSEVLECSVVSGSFDYMIKVVTADVESYHQFYQEKLATLQIISHISSYFVMSEVKNTTSLPI